MTHIVEAIASDDVATSACPQVYESTSNLEDADPCAELAALQPQGIDRGALAAAVIQAEALLGTITAVTLDAPASGREDGRTEVDLVGGLRTAIVETTGVLQDGKITYL